MSNKKATESIASIADLNQWLDKSTTMLLLFDIHLNWTGSCETMIPQLDSLYRSMDDSENRFKILTLEVPKFASHFKESVDLSPSCTFSIPLKEENDGDGVDECDDGDDDDDNGGSLEKLMKKSCCSPLFLAVRNKKVFSVVRGANYPAIVKIIDDHIPKLSDDEDPMDDSMS